ncbi:MAG TPA: hypothetical protein VFF86_10360 [Candidatus Methylomirabilis sp.]|nr:hypothetical protein [Candidatus Methylomirabilis sp.]
MAIKNLAQKTTKHGTVSAIWYDDEEDTFVVQYEFLQLSFYKHEFNAFLDTLLDARENFQKGGMAAFEL